VVTIGDGKIFGLNMGYRLATCLNGLIGSPGLNSRQLFFSWY